MSALRDKYAIVGTGKSRLGQVGANSLALLEEAIKNALDEAGPHQQGCRWRRGARSGRHLFPSSAGRGAARGRCELQHVARQRRREPDPVDHPGRDGDRGRSRHHRGVRLRPRFLVAHPCQKWRRPRAKRPYPGSPAPARASARSSAISARCRSTPSARAGTCSNTARRATISPRSPRRSASTRCAIQKRR